MKVFRHIAVVLLAALLLCSCSGKPKVIPRGTLADIYADMFFADQWLADNPKEKTRVDTMLFYDPIFRRYGYTFEDYDASVRHYLKDPEKFSKIFKNASERLKDKGDYYRKKVEEIEEIRAFNASIRGYNEKDFKLDTFLWRSPFKDSLRRRDSLFRDSLLRDSLIRDSLRLDSLRLDSLRLDSLRRDSLKRARRVGLKNSGRVKRIDKPFIH